MGHCPCSEQTFCNWNPYKWKLLEKLPPTLHGNFHSATHMGTAQSYPSYGTVSTDSARFEIFSFLLQISFKGLGDKLILHTCASGEMATVPGQGIDTPFKVTLFILSFQQTNQIQHLATACFTSPKALSDLEAVHTVCWNDPRHSVTIELYAVTPSSPPHCTELPPLATERTPQAFMQAAMCWTTVGTHY